MVSTSILPGDLAAFHAVITFPAPAIATAALQLTSGLLERASQTHGFEDLGVSQEGELLRVRVIVNVGKFSDVFPLFTSSNQLFPVQLSTHGQDVGKNWPSRFPVVNEGE